MKTLICFTLALYLLTSCASYQYFTFSKDLSPQIDKYHASENDSVTVAYYFSSNGFLNLEINNFSKDLLYVDWEKSFLIHNGESTPFASKTEYFEGSANSYVYANNVDFSGKIYTNSLRRYIPPNTKASEQFELEFVTYQSADQLHLGARSVTGYEETYHFHHANSPLTFESYLYLGDESGQKHSIVQHSFYISEITTSSNGKTPLNRNQMRLSKDSEGGILLGAVVLVGVTAYAASKTVQERPQPNTFRQ